MRAIFVCVFSAGSDLAPPPVPPASLVIWRALLAGGIAGVVSRTFTAPLEKVKILAQVMHNNFVISLASFIVFNHLIITPL